MGTSHLLTRMILQEGIGGKVEASFSTAFDGWKFEEFTLPETETNIFRIP